jgi:hypothetical protein
MQALVIIQALLTQVLGQGERLLLYVHKRRFSVKNCLAGLLVYI